MTNPATKVIRVDFVGQSLQTFLMGKPSHPIYIRGRAWTRMDELKVGDGVVSSIRTLLEVSQITSLGHMRFTTWL
jgi:hypothetical protein